MNAKTTLDELSGSQRRVAKKICDPKIIKRLFNFYKKLLCPRHLHVTNLNVNFYLTIEEEKIEQLIMENNNHLKSHE